VGVKWEKRRVLPAQGGRRVRVLRNAGHAKKRSGRKEYPGVENLRGGGELQIFPGTVEVLRKTIRKINGKTEEGGNAFMYRTMRDQFKVGNTGGEKKLKMGVIGGQKEIDAIPVFAQTQAFDFPRFSFHVLYHMNRAANESGE